MLTAIDTERGHYGKDEQQLASKNGTTSWILFSVLARKTESGEHTAAILLACRGRHDLFTFSKKKELRTCTIIVHTRLLLPLNEIVQGRARTTAPEVNVSWPLHVSNYCGATLLVCNASDTYAVRLRLDICFACDGTSDSLHTSVSQESAFTSMKGMCEVHNFSKFGSPPRGSVCGASYANYTWGRLRMYNAFIVSMSSMQASYQSVS